MNTIENKISKIFQDWKSEILNINKDEIIALNFEFLETNDGIELYLTGHDWYDAHDLWLLDEKWNPIKNFISLGKESLKLERGEIFKIYLSAINKELQSEKTHYKDFKIFCGYNKDGSPRNLQ